MKVSLPEKQASRSGLPVPSSSRVRAAHLAALPIRRQAASSSTHRAWPQWPSPWLDFSGAVTHWCPRRRRLEHQLAPAQPLPAHPHRVSLQLGECRGLAANGQNFSSLGLPSPPLHPALRKGKWPLPLSSLHRRGTVSAGI